MAETKDILSELRQDKNLTQAQLANIFHISSSSISAFELGTRLPSVDVLLEYVKYFDVSADYILGLLPYSNTISSLCEEFTPGKSISDVIDDLKSLTPQQKDALMVVIKNMRFYAEVAKKANTAEVDKK